jgi:hypothetical protein
MHSLTIWKITIIEEKRFGNLVASLIELQKVHRSLINTWKDEAELISRNRKWNNEKIAVLAIHESVKNNINELSIDFYSLFK